MKRLIIPLLFPVFILLLSILSCKKDDDLGGAQSAGSTIMPLKVGNSWTYRVTAYDTTGVLPFSIPDAVFHITRDTTIGNEKWFRFDDGWVANRGDGLWSLSNSGQPYLGYKYPASVNDSYTAMSQIAVVQSTNALVTVLQGQYYCYKYQFSALDGRTVYSYQYCAPNVGVVKFEFFSATLSGRSYLSLSVELKGLVLN